uniref:Uncharacterized protein n=1 Tax=Ciona intestinalis TaxID=7719 RepID=H2XT82_CIOIN
IITYYTVLILLYYYFTTIYAVIEVLCLAFIYYFLSHSDSGIATVLYYVTRVVTHIISFYNRCVMLRHKPSQSSKIHSFTACVSVTS